jgi:tetratricopeptide (TPR) repeat protein
MLRAEGLALARRGDLTRAQQYLSAALDKGYDETIVVPELVKVCVASSRFRAALHYAEPYLLKHPEDAGMNYVVGTIHLALGNVQQATKTLNGALQPSLLMIDAAFSLALIAHKEGNAPQARVHLLHYLQVKPKGRYAARASELLAQLEEHP